MKVVVMPNPYHKANGEFASRDELAGSIENRVAEGNADAFLSERENLDAIEHEKSKKSFLGLFNSGSGLTRREKKLAAAEVEKAKEFPAGQRITIDDTLMSHFTGSGTSAGVNAEGKIIVNWDNGSQEAWSPNSLTTSSAPANGLDSNLEPESVKAMSLSERERYERSEAYFSSDVDEDWYDTAALARDTTAAASSVADSEEIFGVQRLKDELAELEREVQWQNSKQADVSVKRIKAVKSRIEVLEAKANRKSVTRPLSPDAREALEQESKRFQSGEDGYTSLRKKGVPFPKYGGRGDES